MNPVHPHVLRPADPRALYNDATGRWKCDVCGTTYTGEQYPQHCSICSFDVCRNCLTPQSHPASQHPLQLTDMNLVYPQYQGSWKCDACGQVFHNHQYGYHCHQTDFDLCGQCFNGRKYPIHPHPLRPAQPRIIYGTNRWKCDGCRTEKSGPDYAWHCAECQFDSCSECLKPKSTGLHPHPLQLSHSSSFNQGLWKCDSCNQWLQPSELAHHCYTCQFHICQNCYDRVDDDGVGRGVVGEGNGVGGGVEVEGFDEHTPHRPRPNPEPRTFTANHFPPVEGGYEKDSDEPLDSVPEAERCKVCYEKRAVATFLHGSTGHQYSCMSCAARIMETTKKCPICNEPASGVIKTFKS